MGYVENPKLFKKDFYLNGYLNDEYTEFDFAKFSVQPHINGLAFVQYNSCGLISYTWGFSRYNISLEKQLIISSIFFYSYGTIDELVTSQEYDSLVVSPTLDNFMKLEYFSQYTSII